MPDRLEVGIVSRTFFNMPYWIAIQKGFFSEEGLEAVTEMYGNASQVPPLLSGALKVVFGTPESTVQNAADGGPLRIIAGNTGKLTHALIARPNFSRIEELKGGTIGILNMTEGTFFQIKEMLAAHGLRYPQDYKVKETGGVPPRHKALLEGSIDAGLQSIPWNYVAEDAGLKKLGDIIDYVPDWQFVSINANREWATVNRPIVVRFLRAIIRATAWFYANRGEAARIAEIELPTPIHHAEQAWDHYTRSNALTKDVSVNAAGLQKVIDTLLEARLLNTTAPRELGAYVSEEFLQEARRTA
ncbi:MAG: ABC transporter substrate-binding protein [Xanthobacteraceae bacterium]|nr:ABC transporter substrate-binding protein [Xanthobacteraceae bacterium]